MPPLADYWPKAREVVLNAVYPPRCAGCPAFGTDLFCLACRRALLPITDPLCRICGAPFDPAAAPAPECADCRNNRYHKSPAFDGARSLWEFTGPAREAVHALKYRERTTLAPALAEAMAEFLHEDQVLNRLEPHFIVPVPLHPLRRWRRGYNQAELLAKGLASLLDTPVRGVLKRQRFAPPQVGLSREERAVNIRGVFAVDWSVTSQHDLMGARVLLIDDVFTTGATIAECAKVLKRAKCSEVMALTVAREV